MSKSTDTHNVQLTNLEIFVLELILEDFDVELEISYKNGKEISLPKNLWTVNKEIFKNDDI